MEKGRINVFRRGRKKKLTRSWKEERRKINVPGGEVREEELQVSCGHYKVQTHGKETPKVKEK